MSVENIRKMAESINEKSLVLPAGWINETGIVKRLSKEDAINYLSWITQNEKMLEQYDVKTEWYTPITGIYKIQTVPVGFWYPGGRIKDNVNKIELRRR